MHCPEKQVTYTCLLGREAKNKEGILLGPKLESYFESNLLDIEKNAWNYFRLMVTDFSNEKADNYVTSVENMFENILSENGLQYVFKE